MSGADRIKMTAIASGLIWTLVVAVSLVVNKDGTSEVGTVVLWTHGWLWLLGGLGIFQGGRLMSRAGRRSRDVALEREEILASTEDLLDHLPVGVVLIGRDKTIRRINKTALGILRKKEDQVLGSVCHQNICPAQKDRCPILDLHKKVDNSEKTVLDPEGKPLPVLKTVIPFVYRGEEVLLEAFVDISHRQESMAQLTSNLEELQRFNNLAVGRELRMLELKGEINSLRVQLGQPERYASAAARESLMKP